MPSEQNDPVEGMEVGETRELSSTSTMDAYELAWDEFVGWDRQVDNITVDAHVDDDDNIVTVVRGDVTKVDPKVKPVFQTKSSWEQRSDTDAKPTPRWFKIGRKALPHAVMFGVFGVSALVATRVMEQFSGMTINGQPVEAPSMLPVFFVMLIIVSVVYGIQYLPGRVGGGRA